MRTLLDLTLLHLQMKTKLMMGATIFGQDRSLKCEDLVGHLKIIQKSEELAGLKGQMSSHSSTSKSSLN